MNNNQKKIEKVLKDFDVVSKVTSVIIGPSVTRYELRIQPGVKISKIVGIEDNLSLELAKKVRVSGVVPGKSVIGIEVPNDTRKIVSTSALHIPHDMIIPLVLGQDSVSGEEAVEDLTKMPHLLIAGATGTGKSVCINSIIYPLISHFSPMQLQFIMVDPKMVELSIYNGIPHLITPVVTNAANSLDVFSWVTHEMERRYTLLKEEKVRDIKRYNVSKKLPYIIVVIDEFADLMATTKKNVELSIGRLAAMSRAVGIHLILATQRPSTDVITGVIKANFTTRIAFQVATKVDSRTILDRNGAEALTGAGDMLFQNATSITPRRIQGALTSEETIEGLLNGLRVENPKYITLSKSADLLTSVIEFMTAEGKLSVQHIKKEFGLTTVEVNALVDEMTDLHILTRNKELMVAQWK